MSRTHEDAMDHRRRARDTHRAAYERRGLPSPTGCSGPLRDTFGRVSHPGSADPNGRHLHVQCGGCLNLLGLTAGQVLYDLSITTPEAIEARRAERRGDVADVDRARKVGSDR